MLTIFWNSDERRLRFIWRFSLATLMLFITTMFIIIPVALVVGLEVLDDLLIVQLLSGLALLISLPLAIRFLDRRNFSETGIYFDKEWWGDLAFGLILGAVLITVIFLVMASAGWVSVIDTYFVQSGNSFSFALLNSVVLFITIGVTEELMFRGYFLLNLAEGTNFSFLGSRTALILSWVFTSAVFGLVHLGNPDATLFSALNIALAGIWLGTGYVLTGSLAIPIGLHVSWNFFQGVVFGFSVSGFDNFEPRLMVLQESGPELWTGGTFGPEGGLLGTVALIIGTISVALWVRIRTGTLRFHTAIAEARKRPIQKSVVESPPIPTEPPALPGEPEVESSDFTERPPPPKG